MVRSSANKRIVVFSLMLTGIVMVIVLLKVRMDDERYYNIYGFVYPSEETIDFSGGVAGFDKKDYDRGAVLCDIPALHVDPGTYMVSVDHEQDGDSVIQIIDGKEEIASFVLPSSETETSVSFTADHDLYNLKVRFLMGDGKRVTIKHAYLRSVGLFFSDTIIFGMLFIFALVLFSVFLIRKDIGSASNRERLFCLAFPLFFIFLNYAFWGELSLDLDGDMGFLVARIEQTKNELLRGQFPVQIYGDGLDGHGVLGFLYPDLFLYIPAVFRMCHVSMEASLRISYMLTNAATMATSYYCSKRLVGNRMASFLAMAIYTTLPYRLSLSYFRSDMGDLLAMIFIPLVIEGIYEIFVGEKRRWIILTLGVSGILQSHILSTLMIAVFCVIMGLMLVKKLFCDGRIISLLKAAGLTLLLNLWFLLPFYEGLGYDLKLRSMFSVMDFSEISYWPSLLFGMFTTFFKSDEFFGAPMIGPSLWVFLGMFVYFCCFMKIENDRDRFVVSLFVNGILFLLMSLRWFPWQTLSKFNMIREVVGMIQFPIRFGQISQAVLPFAGVMLLCNREVFLRYKKIIGLFCLAASCFLMILISDSWILTLKTDGSIGDMKLTPGFQNIIYEDYAPEGYNGDGFPETPVGRAKVQGWVKDGTEAVFDYTCDEDTWLALPITAYPGFRAFNSENNELLLKKGDNAELCIMLPASVKPDLVRIRYFQPLRWRAALIISLITLAGIILFYLVRVKKSRKILVS